MLNALRRSKAPVAIFLMKGIKLQGVIAGFDNFSIQLRRGGTGQLVYKHSVATIAPSLWPDDLVPEEGGSSAATLQDDFLERARADRSVMNLFLMNGVQLEGLVRDFDQYCLVLERPGQTQMIYKHAISTLQHASGDSAKRVRVAEQVA